MTISVTPQNFSQIIVLALSAVTFTSHITSSAFVLLSNLIIPWKFITLSCFYPYPWVSQLLRGKLFPMVTGILKKNPFMPYTAKEFKPAWISCILSINETSGIFWKLWWVSVSFLPALTWASSSSAESGAAWVSAEVIEQERGRTTQEQKENQQGWWPWLCLVQSTAWSAQTSTLIMVSCLILQKVRIYKREVFVST